MKNIILGIKGFVFGIANIIPGVSGGTLMITLGIYEDVIDTIIEDNHEYLRTLN